MSQPHHLTSRSGILRPLALLCMHGAACKPCGPPTLPTCTPCGPPCARWLAARSWDPARAAHDLAAHAAWRADMIPNGRVHESEVARELAQEKVLIQGLDRHGRAVAILVGGNHVPG